MSAIRGTTLVLALIAVSASALAQNTASQPQALHLTIVEGEGAINNLKSRTARPTIVEVTDENHKPVGGASVTFALPKSGASGAFRGGGSVLRAITNAQGRVIATGFKPNHVIGVFKINVTASLHGHLLATATITQSNALAGAGAAASGAAAGSSGGAGAGSAGSGAASSSAASSGAASGASASTAATTATTTGAATGAGTAGAAGISAGTIAAVGAGVVAAGAVAAKAATSSGNNSDSNTPTPPSTTIVGPGTPIFGPALRPTDPNTVAGRTNTTKASQNPVRIGSLDGISNRHLATQGTLARLFAGAPLHHPSFLERLANGQFNRFSLKYFSIGVGYGTTVRRNASERPARRMR